MLLLALLACTSPGDCGKGGPCAVDSGRYYAVVPDGWDGESELRTMVWFHGWNSDAERQLNRPSLTGVLTDNGVLAVFPDGRNETWAHVGSPSDARDELAFMDEVMADVRARWPVGEVMASGFSQGASMAWDLACYRGDAYDAFGPVSGSFWEPLPETCSTTGPVRLRHTHGTNDGTMPMDGRSIGSWRQGNVRDGLDRFLAHDDCETEPTVVDDGSVTCEVYTCNRGEVQLCLHDGGHERPSGWTEQILEWW